MRIQPVRDFEAVLSMIHAMAVPHDKYKYVPLSSMKIVDQYIQYPIKTVPGTIALCRESTRAYMTFEMSVMAAKLNRC